MRYIAVRQRSDHDVLCIDLQRADRLPGTSVFGFDGKLCDETVDAVRQEPGNHDRGVVLSERGEVCHQARGCRRYTHTQVNLHTVRQTMVCIRNYYFRL